MPRVKRGINQRRRHKRVIKQAKGYHWRRKSVFRLAKEAVWHAGQRSWEHRRRKKGDFRRLWQIRINAAARANDISYSRLIHALKLANIDLDRRALADLAVNAPDAFAAVVQRAREQRVSK